MIPRLIRSSSFDPSAVLKVIVIVAVLVLQNKSICVQSFFHNSEPENIIAPINSAGLLINQLLVNTANFSSLLDQNIDHIKRPVGDYPSLNERSDDYLGSEYAVRAGINCIRCLLIYGLCRVCNLDGLEES